MKGSNVNTVLTAGVKRRAFELGADLVGIGNIERWRNCPEKMSPAGILPGAKSVVVCGLHHVDGMVEIGSETSPHALGPYHYQYYMNNRLDAISYELARHLEDCGVQAVPITASNIWRYRPYKDLTATFAPDMSHIYAAVAAGLAELGFNGLALTPEYGPRNRFISVITDAALTPDPLLPGNTLCDRCMLCAKHCYAGALSEELKGLAALEIEGRRYEFADKNLWRCSWAEHFGLAHDLPKPAHVTEEVILDAARRHGVVGGTMGYCLKYCLPKHLRVWDRAYSSAPRRRKPVAAQELAAPATPLRALRDCIAAEALDDGAEWVAVAPAEACAARGIDLSALLPDGRSLLMLAVADPSRAPAKPAARRASLSFAVEYIAQTHAFSAARRLEDLGYSAAPYGPAKLPEALRQYASELLGGKSATLACVVSSAPLPETLVRAGGVACGRPADMAGHVKDLARRFGADLVGVAPARRLADAAAQLRGIFDGQPVFAARDRGKRWGPYEPEVSAETMRVLEPDDYLPGAKSVLVMGVRVPRASVARAGKVPAEAIGPYVFAQHQSVRTLAQAAVRLIRRLADLGIGAVAAADLCGTSTSVANVRGAQPDAFCNRFAAVAAGLAALSKGGFPLTERFGPHVRFLAIVLDAELPGDAVLDPAPLLRTCESGCRACLDRCRAAAHRQAVSVTVGGRTASFHPVEQARCDWAKRYALLADEGFEYIGSHTDVPPPAHITAEALADALARHDPILKVRPCAAEMCLLSCPLAQ